MKCTRLKAKITIQCPTHGNLNRASNHKTGAGCGECNRMNKQITQKEFINQCIATHRDTYDYSQVVYTGSNDRLSQTWVVASCTFIYIS